MQKPEQVVDCDVLVIGGAAAGLTAAIEARARGSSVVVAAKGKAGRSGNTIVAAGGFAAVLPGEGTDDSPEQHFRDTLLGGKGVNDESLLRIHTEQAGRRVLKLEEWGVRFRRSEGELMRRGGPGHSRPRGLITDYSSHPASLSGLSVTLPLRDTAERMGVRFLDGVPVVRLALRQGEVCGATAIDLERDELVLLRARAVVVAAGGAGRIYSNTNNTREINGDSYGLMLQAGATLKDMEFVQLFPTQIRSPFKASFTTTVLVHGAVLRNRHGERFMHLYDERGELATRDSMSRAIFYEIQKGNGIDGEVYVDCTGVPESVLQGHYFALTRDFRKRGLDPARQWVKVGPTIHFFMGGAEVTGRCETGVPGLFAAGECVGGVHGANRISANALTETVVFGAIAGEVAAEHAAGRSRRADPEATSLTLDTTNGNGESLEAVRSELRRAMWDGAGAVRSESSLRSTLSTVRECSAAVHRCGATTPSQAARREETRLMGLTAEAVVLSALARQESRGAHFREDFPSLEDRWVGNHRVRLAGDRLEVEFTAK